MLKFGIVVIFTNMDRNHSGENGDGPVKIEITSVPTETDEEKYEGQLILMWR